MNRITIKIIPHSEQRYETCGDWFFDEQGNLEIRVSKMDDWRYPLLVAFHELAEVLICKHHDITQAQVDDFDFRYEKDREKGLHGPDEEPGDDVNAPYYSAHQAASILEGILAREIGVDWKEYEKSLCQ